MRKFTRLLAGLLLLCVSMTATAQTPLQKNGQLQVIGLKLCNQYGNPIQLRGMSTHGLNWYPWGDCLKDATLDVLANDWEADALRISMYVQDGGYESDPTKFTNMVNTIVEAVTARGMYAIIDFHQLDPGDPNYNTARAKTFFTAMANAHKNKTNVLYDICNEPNGVSWATIKNYANQVIPVIRAIDPDAPILVGTHAWASMGISDGRSAQDIVSSPLNFTNIMYTFHFYAGDHGTEYLNELDWASDRLPVFVTEFGTQLASGDGPNNFTRTQQYIDLMRTKKISWINWNFSDDFRSGAVWKDGTCPNGPWTVASLKPAGVWIRDKIKFPADDFPGGAGSPTVSITSPAPGASFIAPASVVINANATDADGTISKVEFFNGATKLGEATTAPFTYTWNNVGVGTYSLTAKATDNSNLTTTSAAVSISVTAAPGCDAVSSSGDDGNVAANVLDNNLATRWSASGNGQWIQFCLGNAASITGVQIAFYSGNTRTSSFDVLVGNDGVNWTTAATNRVSSGTSLNLETFNFTPVTGKYVRIVGHGNSVNAWNSYTEVKINQTTGNVAPTVSITSPANNASFTAPASVNITATAADTDGTISKVEFFNGATKLGEATSSPYAYSWSNVAAGSYTLTAKATDNGNASTTSTAVNITVAAPPACNAVTASGDDGNVPANVLDNNLSTRWSASGDGQWIQFCLGSTSVSVTGVQIAFYNGASRTSTFDVLVGNDGTNWTTAATGRVSSGSSTALETFTFTPVTGKYVRIVGHGNSVNAWNSYTEVKIQTAAALMADQADLMSAKEIEQFKLSTYPNPFRGSSTVTFYLAKAAQAEISVFDVTGRRVAILVNNKLNAGNHRYEFKPAGGGTGVYLMRMNIDGKVTTRKLVKE
ncbi:cellulase family glycosylhydrolase [Pseudoflavitalea sp. G-6-1-2]|uniref:cellulase family glycosylhydrolase n=1 Tax=Pseudoflavitalea sp. G-6-1-2 TaxID=2728841 RepID=UPI00146E8C4D|nr:cellulase family glycosylhydrolase [Pseudoflavitalea sp. G-6-1-2]NML21757.1 cellulase family glycosylhydrolase [Pseudoflavitalea sp. G-6-1-2]